ncbi:MAG: alanine--tRNA ligase, partial [Planctomycetota bacterium]
VVQGKRNNFDIDLLQVIVQRVAGLAETPYVEGASGEQEGRNALLRRIADHVRAVTFCITDGAVPGNSGRGYIVRRLIRRATLDINRLGQDDCRLHEVVSSVVAAMGDAYPEIAQRQGLCEQILLSEERSFRRTLGRGLELFQRALQRHQDEGATVFSGDDVFELFTTYGFPHEVTAELAEAEGLSWDEERFTQRMQEFADISKGGRSIEVFQASALRDAKAELGATTFVGYDALDHTSDLLMLEVEGEAVNQASSGSTVRFVLSQTPFYAEAGGQVADAGQIEGEGFVIEISDVQKDDGLVIHSGVVRHGTAAPGPVRAAVHVPSRSATARHHSVTHLLHAALADVLGDHVEQQGSKVEPHGLRFDFSHDTALSAEQIAQVEEWVSQAIAANHRVQCQEMPIDQARAMGAKALFGEKYGNVVRVVRMGPASTELCGGCHVQYTGDIAAFRIVREEAISAGIRRIQAVAGGVAQDLMEQEQRIAEELAEILDCAVPQDPRRDVGVLAQAFKVGLDALPERVRSQYQHVADQAQSLGLSLHLQGDDLVTRVRSLGDEGKRLRKHAEQHAAHKALSAIDDVVATPQQVAGVDLYAHTLHGVDGKALRQAAEQVLNKVQSGVVVLASDLDAKALLMVAVSSDYIDRGLKAGALVAQLAPLIGGGGGGKPDRAQAGGKQPQALPQLFAQLPEILEAQLSSTAGEQR